MRFFIFIFVFFFLTHPAHAAQFYFKVADDPSSRISIPVYIDTEGERLNAFEGTVTLMGNDSHVVRVEDAGSIVTVWLEHPQAGASIRFSGISPGGYQGEQGTLFTIVLEGKATAELSFSEVRAYRNDGEGTEAQSHTESATVVFGEKQQTEEIDTQQPESFSVVLARDSVSFDGKKVLIFAAHDKGKGIAGYDVCEGIFSCVRGDSPYVIQNEQTGMFFVRAYDYDGNVRTATLFTSWGLLQIGFTTLALILLLGLLGARFMRRGRVHA